MDASRLAEIYIFMELGYTALTCGGQSPYTLDILSSLDYAAFKVLLYHQKQD